MVVTIQSHIRGTSSSATVLSEFAKKAGAGLSAQTRAVITSTHFSEVIVNLRCDLGTVCLCFLLRELTNKMSNSATFDEITG